MSSPADPGSANCSRKPLAIWCRPPSRIFFSSAPLAGDDRFSDAHLPVWADHRGRFRYGIPGQRPARIQDCRRHARAGLRSHERRARRQSRYFEGHSRVRRLPLPCPERCAADRNPRLPVRANAGQPLPHRPASRHGKRVAAGWRVRARVQAWTRHRGDDGGVDSERSRAAPRSGAWVDSKSLNHRGHRVPQRI